MSELVLKYSQAYLKSEKIESVQKFDLEYSKWYFLFDVYHFSTKKIKGKYMGVMYNKYVENLLSEIDVSIQDKIKEQLFNPELVSLYSKDDFKLGECSTSHDRRVGYDPLALLEQPIKIKSKENVHFRVIDDEKTTRIFVTSANRESMMDPVGDNENLLFVDNIDLFFQNYVDGNFFDYGNLIFYNIGQENIYLKKGSKVNEFLISKILSNASANISNFICPLDYIYSQNMTLEEKESVDKQINR